MLRSSLLLTMILVTALATLFTTAKMVCAQEQQQELSKTERRDLFRHGAKIWPIACGNCHIARPGGEFSPEQWTLIMRHMQTRAMLPQKDIEAVKIYLQSAHEPK